MIKCTSPYVSGTQAFGCGQCLCCRELRRRIWVHRLMLERLCHEHACFVTLTYRDDALSEDCSVSPQHVQLWLKRLRRRIEPRRVRYYAVGEYGDRSWRPHYHVALYGWPPCSGGPAKEGACQCLSCSVVRETWGFGHVLVGTLEQRSANYVCGYVIKRLTKKDDPRLMGRHPEFSRMSLRPHGIGVDAMWDVASVLMQYKLEETHLPYSLRQGMSQLPIGRYLRHKLSQMSGRSEEDYKVVCQAAVANFQKEVRLLWDYSIVHEKSVKEVFAELNAPSSRQVEQRAVVREL